MMAPCLASTSFSLLAVSLVSGHDIQSLRFRGIRLLYGEHALQCFIRTHVAVVGVGGVGSWAAEAIARTGFGAVTVIDMDEVCTSNMNRQLHALDSTVGRPKVQVLADRIREINPHCAVEAVMNFVTAHNVEVTLMQSLQSGPPRVVIDAVDNVADKCAIIAACKEYSIDVVTVGAAAGKRDCTQILVEDLARVTSDPLLSKVRRLLRREHGFPEAPPRGKPAPWGVVSVASAEPQAVTRADGRADCDSFGTVTHVTGTFGFAAAGVVADLVAASIGTLDSETA